MATEGNTPCTVTRVIDRTAQRVAEVAKTLEAHAITHAEQESFSTNLVEDLKREAAELRQCAVQLTGRVYA